MPTISTPRRWLLAMLLLAWAGVPLRAGGQPAGPFRVGVILQGGAYAGRGDLKSVEAEARVPVVFMVGSDPVALGLVESYRRPAGRFTGVHSQFTDLTGKRLELLKEMIPGPGSTRACTSRMRW